MRRICCLLFVLLQSLVWSPSVHAAPCALTSISGYVALGSAGCTVGSLNFGDFALRLPQNGSVPSSSITVTPVLVGSTVAGLSFGVAPTTSGGGFFDNLITYRVTGIGASLNGATVDFAGANTTGDAAVSVLEQLCLGGTFTGADGVTGCSSGNALNLAVVDIFGVADPTYSLPFGAVGFASVATDIAYDSGSGFVDGSASTLTAGINLFSFTATRAVPEPASGALLVLGVAALMLARRGRARRRS